MQFLVIFMLPITKNRQGEKQRLQHLTLLLSLAGFRVHQEHEALLSTSRRYRSLLEWMDSGRE